MIADQANTFDEYVGWMAINSPQSVVLDWWLRLDRVLSDYAVKCGASSPSENRCLFENMLDRDWQLGVGFGCRIKELRRFRNAVAHADPVLMSEERAQLYARVAFHLIGLIALRCRSLQGRAQ